MIYTLRKAGPTDKPTYELVKWDLSYKRPLDIYTQWIVQRAGGERVVHSCNCPSRSNPCKHAAISTSLLAEANNVDEQLAFFYWSEDVKGVKQTGDM